MLSLSYLAPPSWSLCDANEGTNTSTLSKSPRKLSPETPKRAYQWDRKREKGEEHRTPVSRGFCCHCERILSVVIQIKSWMSMKFETLAYNLLSPIRRFITRFLFYKILLLILFYTLHLASFLNLIYNTREKKKVINLKFVSCNKA